MARSELGATRRARSEAPGEGTCSNFCCGEIAAQGYIF
jgi:hypothetical protein